MKYHIETRESFSILGQEIELSTNKKNNMIISTQFWQKFNQNLRNGKLSQNGNWFKYAFMYRREGKLYYFCAIPDHGNHPSDFFLKNIKASTYLVVEHVGMMSSIYDTYHKIYQEILPSLSFISNHHQFLHFERYDERFHWNRKDSIIEIWVPINIKK